MKRHSLAALLLPILLGTSGCVTAGLAVMGPVIGSLTALGDRSVERTLPADQSTTWGATVDTLARMALRVEQTEKSGNRWKVIGTDGDVTVHVTSERITANMTKLAVRVEAGSLYADKKTGDELLNQIGTALASLAGGGPQGMPAADGSSAAQLSVLQQAIDRLGTKFEEARDGRDAWRRSGRPDPSTASPSVTTSPIITIPTSAGVATVPGPAPALITPVSAPAPPRQEREVTPSSRVLERRGDGVEAVMARPLNPAETLRPVEGLTIRAAQP